MAPIYSNFESERERAPKNAIFGQNFPKKCHKCIMACFFFKIRPKIWTKYAFFSALGFGGARKINLVGLNKKT